MVEHPIPVGWYVATYGSGDSNHQRFYVRSLGKLLKWFGSERRTSAVVYPHYTKKWMGFDGYSHSIGTDNWTVTPIEAPPPDVLEAYVRAQLKEALDG